MATDWSIYNVDCIDIRDLITEPASLVYIDPPYGPVGEDTYYGVGNSRDEYLSFMRARISALVGALKPNGSFVLHVDQKYSHRLRVVLDDVLGEDAFQNEIVWCYSGPSRAARWFPRKHDTLLWYAREAPLFNQPRVPYVGTFKVGGKTSWAGKNVDKEEYLKQGKALEDWWTDPPALQRNEKEKTGYKTQKPLALLNRIVSALTNPGDLVVDGFCGSGTTGASALMLGRRFLGTDVSKVAADLAASRLKSLHESRASSDNE